jgi:hypothetical protein
LAGEPSNIRWPHLQAHQKQKQDEADLAEDAESFQPVSGK